MTLQKIVVSGARLGVLNAARKVMAIFLGGTKYALENARHQFWVLDAMVLVTEARKEIDLDVAPFSRNN